MGNRPVHSKTQIAVVEKVQRHIEQTAGRGADLDSLSQIGGYSKYHLLRVFKTHTGQTIHQYVDRCRWERFRKLRQLGISKGQIAEELGFSCLPAFSRWHRHGQPPVEEMEAESVPAQIETQQGSMPRYRRAADVIFGETD